MPWYPLPSSHRSVDSPAPGRPLHALLHRLAPDRFAPRLLVPLPKIPGTDLAGEIVEAPAGSGIVCPRSSHRRRP
jgi:hypothetical protein